MWMTASPLLQSSTTWIVALLNQFVRRFLKVRAGGTRRFRQRGGRREPFVWTCFQRAQTRWMLRYNIIQWVHRYTRGWSYGAAIADPRTGEIIKGNVTLGSLRARQDYLIAEALLSPYGGSASGAAGKSADNPMLQMVLARIRQLAAHETGHTLGLAHNFAASTVTQGDSVMDYPHPYITLDSNGHVDVSHAYATGIGDWDKVAINYGYREFGSHTTADEQKSALDKILSDSDHAGQLFITDEDARPFGSAHPRAHLWDNGSDPAAELDRVLAVRAAALKSFGENAIRPGTPMAQLEQTLVPLVPVSPLSDRSCDQGDRRARLSLQPARRRSRKSHGARSCAAKEGD